MTNNQINFNKLIEEGRHNVVTERQRDVELQHIGRQAEAAWEQARVAGLRQIEESRANREREATNWFQARETQRSNLVKEMESARSNLNKERIQEQMNLATARHYSKQDEVAEREAKTHAYQAESGRISALAASMQASTSRGMLMETQRSNLVHEQLIAQQQAEVNRANMAREYETMRANTAKERETQRHNMVSESQQSFSNRSDRIRANAAKSQAESAAMNASTNRGKAIADTVLGGANILAGMRNTNVTAIGRLGGSIIGGALRGK